MISIILPTYNEKESIVELINECIIYTDNLLEIIIIDDNSNDGTQETIKNLNNDKVKLIIRCGKKSLPKSILQGINESKGDIIILMDSDLSHHPKYIPYLAGALSYSDVAVASRYAPGGKDLRLLDRVITSRMINILASLVFFTELRDYTSGYAAIKRKVFDKIAINTSGYGEYFIEFIVDAMRVFNVVEIPYEFKDRENGISKTSPNIFSISMMRHGVFYTLKILKVFLKRVL